jgi:hypothetical protein
LLDAQGDPELQAECEETRNIRKVLARRRLAILTLRRERRRLSTTWLARPRGNQMNWALGCCVWNLAERVKKETEQYNWELVAEMLSEYLPIKAMSANQALKAHRRYSLLLKDRKKWMKVIQLNFINNNWLGRDGAVR